jgi:flagellar hook-associated protein 2
MAITPINLGNFFTNGSGANVASGISSGLNSDSLIKALTAAQTAQITGLEDQVKVNDSQGSALGSLKQILTSLQSAIAPLSNPSNVDPTNNLFAVRSTEITSNTTQAATNYVTASVTSGTASGTYTITEISQLATNTTQETNSFTLASATTSVVPAVPAAGFFSAGTITILGQSITISTGDSLGTIAQNFNAVSDTTGIAASVLQTSPGVYKLIFTSTETGVAARFNLNTLLTGNDPSGVFSNITVASIQSGENAAFKLNNISITRPSNNIDDLIDGVTVNLLQNTVGLAGASITLQIAPDIENIAQGVVNFATAYNNFLYFYSQQTERGSDGIPKDTALLSSDTTLRNVYNSVTSIAASLVKGLPDGALNTLASLGITFTDFAGSSTIPTTGNILSVDTSTLKSLLLTDFSGVEDVFGDGFSSSSSELLLYKSATNSQGITDFTLDIVQGATPSYIATYLDSENVEHQVSFTGTVLSTGGVSLLADPDSIFAGMQLIYGGTGNATDIAVTVTQGLLSRLKTSVDAAVKTSSGLIANSQQAIVDKNTELQKQITTVTEQMNTTRQSLLQKYAALEAAISKANSVLNLLNAQQLASQT